MFQSVASKASRAARILARSPNSRMPITVRTRTEMRGITPYPGREVYLSEPGREGTFIWTLGDYSALIALDALTEGLYVKSNGTASSFGAWVRRYVGAAQLKWFGAVGDGTSVSGAGTDDSAALTAALTLVTRIAMGGSTYRIGTNVTVAANVVLAFPDGGKVAIDTGVTITMNIAANIDAPARVPIVASAANGNFSNLRVSYPEWWGAFQSTSLDSSAAFQAGVNALKTQGRMILDAGFYAIAAQITITNGVHIIGQGKWSTNVRVTTAAANFVAWTTQTGGGLQSMDIWAKTVTPTSGAIVSVPDNAASKMVFRDLVIDGCWDGMNFAGPSTSLIINGCEIDNVHIYGAGNGAIKLQNVESFNIRRLFIDAQAAGAVSGCIRLIDHCQDVNFTDGNSSNGSGPALSITATSGTLVSGSCAQWCSFTNFNFDGANVGIDLNNCEQIRFINPWSASNGRTIDGHAGPGVWIRSNCKNIKFLGGVCSNNGERAFRVDNGATDIYIDDMEIVGNNYNGGTFYSVDVFGNTTDFAIRNCLIGTSIGSWTVGTPTGGVQVRAGTSDRYQITGNRFQGFGTPGTSITDNGTGVNKDVATGNLYR